ncbi:bacteriocin fulvocin C-related protein, partial [Winogradskyella sp.]|nr:bacteriocin fulvocin C-related protein [Winogradskyella sp.]
NADMFSDISSDNKEYFKNILVPKYLENAKVTFRDKFLMGVIFYELFAPSKFILNSEKNSLTLEDLKKAYNSDSDMVAKFAPKQCNCAEDSFFSCEWGQGSKKCKVSSADPCEEVTDCGFNWMFDCDGLCNPLLTHEQ